MAALGLLGAKPAEPSERQLGRFQRGKDAQRYVAQRFAAKYGPDAIEHERAVPWPAPPALPVGELHEDLFVRSEALVVEVKSSEHVDSVFDMALLQVKGQVHFDPEAEMGVLLFVDRDYQETDRFPVVLTDEDVEEIEEIAAAVVTAGKTGELPPRVCEKPSDGIQRMCPFIEECFRGWEPPAVEERPDLAGLVTEAYLAWRELKERQEALGPYVERWEEAKAALEQADLPEGLTVAGQVAVQRTVVREAERFSLAKAIKLGLFTAQDRERFDSCIKVAKGHSRWSFRRIGDEALDIDYGDEPPF
jgi:hypothetical protein